MTAEKRAGASGTGDGTTGFPGAARWLPFAAALAIAARRMAQIGPLPTGLDGGEWLAIGRGLLGGEGRLMGGAYAPLVPVAADLLAGSIGPIPAVRLLAAVSLAAVLLAVAWVASDAAGPLPATAAVIAIGSASAVTEPFAFGGYPQHLAFAAVLTGIYLVSRYLAGGGGRERLSAAAAFALAAVCHHVYFPAGVAAAVAATAAWWVMGTGAPGRTRAALRAAAVLLPSMALALPTLLAFRAQGYAPPLEAASFGLAEAWRYSTREAVVLWGLVVLAGALSLALMAREASAGWYTAFGLMAAGGLGFLLYSQPRLMPMLLAGAVIACAVGLRHLPRRGVSLSAAAAAAAIAVAILLARGDGEATAFLRFYRVLDASTIAAVEAIEAADAPGAVAVRQDRRGWPVGWWYEGLADRPVLVGSDPRWLGFPGERETAATVAALFDGSLSPDVLRQRAGTAGVSLLACRKWDWIGWERWLGAPDPAVEVVFDDDETIILRVKQPESAGRRGV